MKLPDDKELGEHVATKENRIALAHMVYLSSGAIHMHMRTHR